MADILYGCGFNGFSQLDSFKIDKINGLCFKDSGKGHDTGPKVRHKVDFPKALLTVQRNGCVVHEIILTWAQIGITVDNGGCYKSFVMGFSNSSCDLYKTDKSVSHSVNQAPVLDNQIVSACTTSCLLFSSPAKPEACKVLHDGTVNLESIKIRQQEGSKVQNICGGHRDFFIVYDSISFGKLSAITSSSLEKEAVEQVGDQFVTSFDIVSIDSGIPIQEISCGREHTLCLSKHGSIYSYGLGSRGQLGHGSVDAESTLRLVDALEGVRMTAIGAGGWHSAAVSETGDLYTWGWNESGQLGISSLANRRNDTSSTADDESVGIQAEPYCIDIPGDLNVTQVACGSRHTVLLTENGKVFTCGWNAYGQLGLGHTKNRDSFSEVTLLEGHCYRIYAGEWNTLFLCEINK